MQRKRYITFFFIFISMVMLVVPVIPHHHHNNGLICMKNDITPNCCGQQHTPDSEHCCCDTGCVTTHFFHANSQLGQRMDTSGFSTGYHIILRTPSQTIGPPRRKRAKTGLHIPGVTSWHVSHTCHRTSRTSVCSYFIVKSATLLQAFISNFAHR